MPRPAITCNSTSFYKIVSAKREMLVRSAISLTSESARRQFGVSLRTFDQSRRNPEQPLGPGPRLRSYFFLRCGLSLGNSSKARTSYLRGLLI